MSRIYLDLDLSVSKFSNQVYKVEALYNKKSDDIVKQEKQRFVYSIHLIIQDQDHNMKNIKLFSNQKDIKLFSNQKAPRPNSTKLLARERQV